MSTLWPINRPIDSPEDALQAETSLPGWVALSQGEGAGLHAVYLGSSCPPALMVEALDDRRVELLAHRLVRSYETMLDTCAPEDHGLLSWVIGPRLSVKKQSSWVIDHNIWRFNSRYEGAPEGQIPHLQSLFKAAWFPPEASSLFEGFERVLFTRFANGVDCELGSWEESLWSMLTSIHLARRHAQRQLWNAAGHTPLLDEGLFQREMDACLAQA